MLFLLRSKPLTGGTEMGATLSDDEALDLRTTAPAWPALLFVHIDMIVVVTGLAPEIAVVVEGGSSVLDAQRQYGDNALMERTDLVRRERCAAAQRMVVRVEEGLVRVYVPHARDHRLIQQRLLDAGSPLRQRL